MLKHRIFRWILTAMCVGAIATLGMAQGSRPLPSAPPSSGTEGASFGSPPAAAPPASPGTEGASFGSPMDTLYPLIYFPQTQFTVGPNETAKVNYVAQCSSNAAELGCSVQIFHMAESGELLESYTLNDPPAGIFKYLPPGRYVFRIGNGSNWAEIYKTASTKVYLVTVIEQ